MREAPCVAVWFLATFVPLLFGTVYKNLWLRHDLGNFCLTVFGVSTDKVTEVACGADLLRGRIMSGRIMCGQIRHAARHALAAGLEKRLGSGKFASALVMSARAGWLLQRKARGKNSLVLSRFSPTLFPVVTSKSNSSN